MFNSTSGFSIRELKKGQKLYLDEQRRFFGGDHPPTRWAVHRTSLAGVPGRIPETMEDGITLRCRDVRVVTERQFVHDDECFYAYRENERFKSFRWLLPRYSLYDVELDTVFASFG